MVFEVQGKTEKYVKLLKDGDGVKFLGKFSMDSIIRLGHFRLLEFVIETVHTGRLIETFKKIDRLDFPVLSNSKLEINQFF